MKRASMKSIAASLRERLVSLAALRPEKEALLVDPEQLAFEAFFRGAALCYMEHSLPAADTEELFMLMQDIFPKLPDGAKTYTGIVYGELSKLPREMWKDNVQLIGKLYQYYNSERKERAFNALKKNIKISPEDLPAATQIFTPEWIVKYMTENTLGRMFARYSGYDVSRLEYYVTTEENAAGVPAESITFIDPCMGSGNILVYAFDMFMDMYRSQGVSCREAAELILSRNLFGLDIDSRMCRIASFALIMRAASYAPEIIKNKLRPQLYDTEGLYSGSDADEQLRGSELYGALMRPVFPYEGCGDKASMVCGLLNRSYDVVVTNPPYMSSSNMSPQLLDFIKKNYSDYRADLFSAFMVRCMELAKPDGELGFLTPYVWMFIQSYEKLRRLIFGKKSLETLIQLEYSAFNEATVPVCAFTMRNRNTGAGGIYFRLTDFRGGLEVQRTRFREALSHKDCGYVYERSADDFGKIPGAPAAYWLSSRVYGIYESCPSLGSIAAPRKGNSTSDNSRFLRLWHEVDINSINLGCRKIIREETRKKRWFPYNKGGGYRKWYGFNYYITDWYDDGAEIRRIPTAVVANYRYFMRPGLTWSTLTSGRFSIRAFEEGYIFDNGGCCIFDLGEKKLFICGLLNSKVFEYLFGQLNPTLNFQSGDVARFPVKYEYSEEADRIAGDCIAISREDYDSFETSRDFKRHPLI